MEDAPLLAEPDTTDMEHYLKSADFFDRETVMIEAEIARNEKQRNAVLLQEHVTHKHLWDEMDILWARLDHVTKRFNINVQAYAKLSCRPFSQKFHATLPLELRQMVYSYLRTGDLTTVNNWPVFPWYRRYTNPSQIRAKPYFLSCPTSPFDGLGPAHYWSAEYVGPDVARELAEDFYSNTYFNFDGNHHLISRVLMEDRWRLDLLPHNHISHVWVELFAMAPNMEFVLVSMQDAERLFSFKDHTKFMINIKFPPSFFRDIDEDTIAYVDHIHKQFPILSHLSKAGYRVSFRLSRSYEVIARSRGGLITCSLEEVVNEYIKQLNCDSNAPWDNADSAHYRYDEWYEVNMIENSISGL